MQGAELLGEGGAFKQKDGKIINMPSTSALHLLMQERLACGP